VKNCLLEFRKLGNDEFQARLLFQNSFVEREIGIVHSREELDLILLILKKGVFDLIGAQ